MKKKILATLSALAVAAGMSVAVASPAHAASCTAHIVGPWMLEQSGANPIVVNGSATCDSYMDSLSITAWVLKNGTVVDADSYVYEGTAIAVTAEGVNSSGNQTWCGKVTVYWDGGGSNSTGWVCESESW